jgi:hypothetical protein
MSAAIDTGPILVAKSTAEVEMLAPSMSKDAVTEVAPFVPTTLKSAS